MNFKYEEDKRVCVVCGAGVHNGVVKHLSATPCSPDDVGCALRSSIPPVKRKTVPELLREGAETYEQRNALYKDNYKRIGHMMPYIFPNGVPPMTPEGWNRFFCWFMSFGKMIRYGMQMEEGGHKDSAHDSMVYSAMLEELTERE